MISLSSSMKQILLNTLINSTRMDIFWLLQEFQLFGGSQGSFTRYVNDCLAWLAVFRNLQPEVRYCKLPVSNSIVCQKMRYFYSLNLKLPPAPEGKAPWSPSGHYPWIPLVSFSGPRTHTSRLFHFLPFPSLMVWLPGNSKGNVCYCYTFVIITQ